MNLKLPLLILLSGLSCQSGFARPVIADVKSCLDVLPGADPSPGMACRTGAGVVFERTRDGWLDTASTLVWHDEIPANTDPTTHNPLDFPQGEAQELCRAKGWR